jgi:predicted Zn-dependent peptidase
VAEPDKKIEGLTPEQVVAAVRNHLDPEKLIIVTAGDFGDPPAR